MIKIKYIMTSDYDVFPLFTQLIVCASGSTGNNSCDPPGSLSCSPTAAGPVLSCALPGLPLFCGFYASSWQACWDLIWFSQDTEASF